MNLEETKMNNPHMKELAIKLKNVYPKDMYFYICQNGEVVAINGTLSVNKTYGKCTAILVPKWGDVVKEAFPLELGDIIYIPSVENLKQWAISDEEIPLKSIYQKIDDKATIREIKDSFQETIFVVDHIDEWKLFVDDPSFIPTIFKEKAIYHIKINDDIINIGKAALPLLTEKNAEKLSWDISFNMHQRIYALTMKFNFTHFQLYMEYFAVPMKE